MIFDLTELAKLNRVNLKPGHIVKYLEIEGDEPLPAQSKMWLSFKKYNFKGELILQQKSIIYRQSDNERHRNPKQLGKCLSTMKKGETSWLRFSGFQAYGDESPDAEGVYYHLSVQKFKVLSSATDNFQDRKEIFKENKKLAKQYYIGQDYKNAFDFYKTCKNSYNSIPKKRDLPEQIKNQIDEEIKICDRNISLCVLNGKMSEQYERYKIIMENMVKKEPNNAKNLYILGKIQLAMKYVSFGKESLQRSYKLEPNQKVLEMIKDLQKKETNQKFVFKKVLNQFEEFNQKQEISELRRKKEEEQREGQVDDESQSSGSWCCDRDDDILDEDEQV